MKLESDKWVECVIYKGIDRITNKINIFCKRTDDFIKEFESA